MEKMKIRIFCCGTLYTGDGPEYKPFRDLRSVPHPRFHFDLGGGGGLGEGMILKTMPNFGKDMLPFLESSYPLFWKEPLQQTTKGRYWFIITHADISIFTTTIQFLENVWKNKQSVQPRSYSFVSRYNIFCRLPRQIHRLRQQQQLVIVGFSHQIHLHRWILQRTTPNTA